MAGTKMLRGVLTASTFSQNFFPKTAAASLVSARSAPKRVYSSQPDLTSKKQTYMERIEETRNIMTAQKALGRNFGDMSAETFVRQAILGEFDGIPFSGINISKWAAKKIRADLEAYQQDPSKYTMSLGAASGLFAQQCIIAAKKERGSLHGIYVYLSGWQVAAKKAPESPQPDVSAHSKHAVVSTIEEIYRFLHQADQVEKVKLFNEIDAARQSGASEAVLHKLYKKLDDFETHIVPMIADVDA